MPRMISVPPPSLPALSRRASPLADTAIDGNGRDRDRGAEPHHEGRGDAGPEQALRQRKHQHQDRARTGPHADGEDRAQTALPAAGAGELIRRRAVRMAAMLVVNVVMVVRMVMAVMVIMMAMIMAVIVIMMMRAPPSPAPASPAARA